MFQAHGGWLLGAAGLIAVLASPAPAEPIKFFYTNFSGKTIDAPIGTGGPAVGEPTEVQDVDAVVRMTRFATPSLEFTDIAEGDPGWSRFTFLEGRVATEGTMHVRFKLWFDQHENFGVYLRPAGSLMMPFLNLRFHEDGAVTFSDIAPGFPIGTYDVDREIRVDIAYRMDEGTYDVFLNGNDRIINRACDSAGEGIGALYFAMERDADVGGSVAIDDVDVYGEAPTPVDASSWGRMKDLFTR